MEVLSVILVVAVLTAAISVFFLIRWIFWRKRFEINFRSFLFRLAEKQVGFELTPMPEDGNKPKVIIPYLDFVYEPNAAKRESLIWKRHLKN